MVDQRLGGLSVDRFLGELGEDGERGFVGFEEGGEGVRVDV